MDNSRPKLRINDTLSVIQTIHSASRFKDGDGNYLDADGNKTVKDSAQKIEGLHKDDRSLGIGFGLPGSPHLVFPKDGGTKLVVGVGNGLFSYDLKVPDIIFYYWREKL